MSFAHFCGITMETIEYFDYLVKEINEETDPVKRNKLKQAYFIELYSRDAKENK